MTKEKKRMRTRVLMRVGEKESGKEGKAKRPSPVSVQNAGLVINRSSNKTAALPPAHFVAKQFAEGKGRDLDIPFTASEIEGPRTLWDLKSMEFNWQVR